MAKINMRNRNEGKLYKDGRKKPANWEYRFEGASIDGSRKWISKSGYATKKEAQAAGAKAMAEYDNAGSRFVPSEMSFADYLDYWYENYVLMNCKHNTQLNYMNIIEGHLKPALGQFRLKSLTPIMIQEYVNQKVVTGLKKNTLSNIFAVLTGSLKYAVVPAALLQDSPAQYIRIPKTEMRKNEINRTIISSDDFDKMMDKFGKGNPFRYALLIGYYTGMRIGEVYGLTWDDIDLAGKAIDVNKQLYKRSFGVDIRKSKLLKGKKEEKCGWYFGSTKTLSSNRKIIIGDILAGELREFKKIQMENQLQYGEYYNYQYKKEEKDEKGFPIIRILQAEASLPIALDKANMVFKKENGEMSTSDSFKYAARIIKYDMGITFNFHSLRHTHATMLIESGVSPKSVQKRLGHENIETTLQTYVHDTAEMAQDAADIFDNITRKMSTKHA